MNCVMKGKRILGSAIFLSVLGLSLHSCKKEDSAIGLDLQPEDEVLNALVVDTFALKTYSKKADSSVTDETFVNENLVGSYVDPVFGKTTCTIYTQLGLSVPGVSVDMGITTIDSVHLQVKYYAYYGDLDPQTFTVQRITEKFSTDDTIRSTKVLTTDGVELVLPGTGTVTPDFTNNVIVGTDTIKPILLLKLDPNTIGADIMNGIGAGHLATETAFNDFFYGFRIGVDNPGQAVGSGGILYMDMKNTATKMVIYYTEGGVQKQLSFPVGENQARFSNFVHDYTGFPVADLLADPSLGQKTFYSQSTAGIDGIIEIPGIDGIKNLGTNIIIHRAELYLPVQNFIINEYKPASNNAIVYKTEDGRYANLIDILDLSTYSGVYVDSKKAVMFNIARHVQSIVKGEMPNLGFKLSGIGTSVSANRNIYNGQQTTNREKPYLKIYYTKF